MDLYEELLALIDALAAQNVNYAVCGGIAVSFHGLSRFTEDIDVLVRPEDLQQAVEIAGRLGFDLDSGIIPLPRVGRLHRLVKVQGGDALVLDLLLVEGPLEHVWKSRERFEMKGRILQVASREGLAWMKRQTNRSKDRWDLEFLEGRGELGE